MTSDLLLCCIICSITLTVTGVRITEIHLIRVHMPRQYWMSSGTSRIHGVISEAPMRGADLKDWLHTRSPPAHVYPPRCNRISMCQSLLASMSQRSPWPPVEIAPAAHQYRWLVPVPQCASVNAAALHGADAERMLGASASTAAMTRRRRQRRLFQLTRCFT